MTAPCTRCGREDLIPGGTHVCTGGPVGAAPGPEPSAAAVKWARWRMSDDNEPIPLDASDRQAAQWVLAAVDHVAPAGESDEVRQLRDILSHVADAIGLAPYYGAYRVEDVLPRLRERLAAAAGEPLRDRIEAILRRHQCQHNRTEDGDPLSLVDVLSPFDTVVEGQEEIHLIADNLAAELLGAAPSAEREGLTLERAEAIEAEIRRAEADPSVDKHALRLLMQSAMPCGHSYGELMTCDSPPFGCAACQAALRAPCRTGPKDPA